MTPAEKYVAMNNSFCKFRDAIYEEDVEEAEEPKKIQESVEMALGILCSYLDYYKENNNVQTREKK